MKIKKEMLKNIVIGFVPVLIVSLILIIIYMLKGIYPFGNMTIAHADMGQIFINNYIYYIESIYSGEFSNFLYSNELNYGTKILGSALPSGFFSPFSLMYLLCKDVTKLPYAMSIFLIVKVGLSSITSYICFKKLFGKENYKFNIIFSVQYALSSFVLINYTTIIWLDVIIIFPLIVLALKNIINKKSFIPYSILLTISITIHYQMAYAILFMILATIAFSIKEYSKEDRKEIILRLGIGTIFGLLLPSVVFLPAIEIFLNSYRTSMQDELFNGEVFFTKLSYMLFSGIGIYGFLKLQKNIKKDKNIRLLNIFIILTGIMPIVFEGINEFWHGGKYDCFPFRFGFIPTFFLNLAANYYYSKYMEKPVNKVNKKNGIIIDFISIIAFLLAIGCSICVSYITGLSSPAFGTHYLTVVVLILYNIFIYILLESLILNVKNKFLYSISIIEVLIFAFGFVGIEEEYRGFQHSDWQIFNSFMICEDFENKLDFDSGYKYKDPEFIMLENSPLVTNLPSNSSWILTTKEQIELHTNLGYSRFHLKLNSDGGTIFSDAILNLKYTFSKNELSDLLYNKIAENDYGIKMYETKNNLPIGIVYDSKNNLENVPDNLNKIQFSNWIYKNLFFKEDDILEIEDKHISFTNAQKIENSVYKAEKESELEIEFLFDIQGGKKLYFIQNDNIEYIKIEKNGEIYQIYPSKFINGIVDLGTYKDETVKIKIYTLNSNEIDINNFEFATIDLDKFYEIFSNNIKTNYKTQKNEVYVEVTVDDENKKIFLPISYDENWIAEINGKEVEIENVIGSMISLDLEKGHNDIKLTLKNDTIKIGFIITIVSLIGLIITEFVINKCVNLSFMKNVIYIVFNITLVFFVLIVYIGGIIITFVG